MTIIYCADDGTQFDSEQKCREYEASQIDNIIICKDSNGKRIPYDNYKLLEKSYFIICKTSAAVEIIQRRSCRDKINISAIDRPGAYYWSEQTAQWESISERISYLTTVAKNANNEKAKLMKIMKN